MKKILKYMTLVVGLFDVVSINTISYGMIATPPYDFDAAINANQDLFYNALNAAGQKITYNKLPVKVLPIRFFHKIDVANSYVTGALTEFIFHRQHQTPQLVKKEKAADTAALKKHSKQSPRLPPQFTIENLMEIPPRVSGLLDVILCRRPNFFPCNVDMLELLEFVRRHNTVQLTSKTGEIKLLVFDLAWEGNDTSESDLSHMFAHHVAHHDTVPVAPMGRLHQSYFIFPEELDLSRDSQRIMTTMLLIGLGSPLKSFKAGCISFNSIDSVQCYYIPKDSTELLPCDTIPKITKSTREEIPCAEIAQNPLSIMKIYIR